MKWCSIKKKCLSIPVSLNDKLQVKNEVQRDTHRLKGNKEASAKYRGRPYVGSNSGEGDFSLRWSKTWKHRLADWWYSGEIYFFRWNIVIFLPQRLYYLLEKTNEVFTDELIWGLGSAPQYSGWGWGWQRAGVEMQQDWPPADSGWSWGWYMKRSLHCALCFCKFL